ncbi:fatty acid cis/trans isomerase [Flocculibacter collagenilyticus]|uniref:fatty acid cis/trans isomerase n=1 Tax=Flocculibacter collagenilyticus TaxID=2744479 RepID=UPI0018F4E811|nr:fatty acid cis/trans isomerase [Flocculibacter collagenilyticus]
MHLNVRSTLIVLFYIWMLPALAQASERTDKVVSQNQEIEFHRDIKPIFDKNCIACHACYDAPCQLKLESAEGVRRGASKQKVYDGTRIEDIQPTRLGVDAQTVEAWRKLGFFDVVSAHADLQSSSILQKMVQHGHAKQLKPNQVIPKELQLGLDREYTCPNPGEFEEYVEDFPYGGMPYAVTGLANNDFATLATWLQQGAKIFQPHFKLSESEVKQIDKWEQWLNSKDKRIQLTARYLYEHLFLAHLYFLSAEEVANITRTDKLNFFKLVRSTTPSGKPVIPIPTTRPNDKPQQPFFYRLVPITSTIVHKTHITYQFDAARLEEYKTLFLKPEWSVGKLPGYDLEEKANPFETFSAMPATSRYQFLLNDAEFFVRNFIRGPVCRGQIATDVIRDQFWVMFEDPNTERYTNNPNYRAKVNSLLGVPGQKSGLSELGSEWLSYQNKRNTYLTKRQEEYNDFDKDGASLAHIWTGEATNPNAFLTILRHHNSASVMQGWKGGLPLTAWVMDYPLFERTFYELVVGFNVYGSVSHQAQTRLYFDLIRNEGETNFLRFLPPASREKMYSHWYQNSGKLKHAITYHELDTSTPTNIKYQTKQPKNELLKRVMAYNPELTKQYDGINRCKGDVPCSLADKKQLDYTAKFSEESAKYAEAVAHQLSDIAAVKAKQLPAVLSFPDTTFIRVRLPNGEMSAFSILRNRRHSNVAFMLGESLRYQESLDSLTILPSVIGSYPNLIFDIKFDDVPKFIARLKAAKNKKSFAKIIDQWGIRRMHPDFWNIFHSFTDYMKKHEAIDAGIYDLNRYPRWAKPSEFDDDEKGSFLL